MPILSRLYGWLAAAGAIIVAVAAAVFYGWRKGSDGVEAKVVTAQAQQKVNTAEAVVSRNEVRTHVDAEVAKLPANPAVEVHVPTPKPVPGSAADQLQQGWSRD